MLVFPLKDDDFNKEKIIIQDCSICSYSEEWIQSPYYILQTKQMGAKIQISSMSWLERRRFF